MAGSCEIVQVLNNLTKALILIYAAYFSHILELIIAQFPSIIGSAEPLPWTVRIKVAEGAARGLSFLHDSESQIIYRDVKASNILLDSVCFAHKAYTYTII